MNNCWILEKCWLAPLQKIDLCTRYQNNSSTEICEEVGTHNKHNLEDVGRRHSNANDHHSGSPKNMVVDYHIMDSRKVPKNVCLVLVGRLKRVVDVHWHMALDSVLHLEKYVFIVVSSIIFNSVVDPIKMCTI